MGRPEVRAPIKARATNVSRLHVSVSTSTEYSLIAARLAVPSNSQLVQIVAHMSQFQTRRMKTPIRAYVVRMSRHDYIGGMLARDSSVLLALVDQEAHHESEARTTHPSFINVTTATREASP